MVEARQKINWMVALATILLMAAFTCAMPVTAYAAIDDDQDASVVLASENELVVDADGDANTDANTNVDVADADANGDVVEQGAAPVQPSLEATAEETPAIQDELQLTTLVTQDEPLSTDPEAESCEPVAKVEAGGGYEIVQALQIDEADYIVLPSYADLSALSISWTKAYLELGKLVFASATYEGSYSDSIFDATTCAIDESGARAVYIRPTATGVTRVLHVVKSGGVRTMYLKSDDPVTEGRAYIEASPDHSASTTGRATLVTAGGETVIQNAELSQIKGRGNSTWGGEKKPYQIKLSEKASLLDGTNANKAKTWVLLANAFDETQMRNYIALKTALSVGLSATPDCEFVDLYYDGEYRGLYLLTEKVQVAKGRVEISEIDDEDLEDLPTTIGVNSYGYLFRYVDNGSQESGADVTGGFLIELDNANYNTERCYFNTSVGYFVLKSPENATYAQVKYISEFVQAAIDAASAPDGNAAQYFDLTSLAQYFLVNEFAKSTDYMRYSSTYFYKDAGSDVLHAGPVWDFDLSFGVHAYEGYAEYIDATGITDPNSTFFVRNKQFVNVAKQVLLSEFLPKARVWTGASASSLGGIVASMASALEGNELLWGDYDPKNVVVVKFDTLAESQAYLIDWLKRRISWMESEMAVSLDALCTQPAASPGSSAEITRLSGETALDTMSEIVDAGGFTRGRTVILVTSDGYWDALTASGIAGMVDAPIIMTPSTYLAAQAREQLAKLRPSTIIICGGTIAISDDVAQAASKAAGYATIERCWGKDAVGTAIAIYSRATKLTGGKWGTTAFVCTNDGYWDALSAAPISYDMHMPIFLTNGSTSISDETLEALRSGGIRAVYIVGGTFAISTAVENAIKDAGIVVAGRLAGESAIETSEEVAAYGINRGMSANLMGVATTNGYWDALSGSAFCGKKHSVLVLVNGPMCHSITSFMFLNSVRVRQAYVFGGVVAVAQKTLEAARKSLSGQLW